MSAALDIGKTRPQNHFPGSRLIAWLGFMMNRAGRLVHAKRGERQARRRSEIRRLYAACVVEGAFRTFDIMGAIRISPRRSKRVVITTDPSVRDSIELFGDWRQIGLDIEKATRNAKQEATKGQLSLFE